MTYKCQVRIGRVVASSLSLLMLAGAAHGSILILDDFSETAVGSSWTESLHVEAAVVERNEALSNLNGTVLGSHRRTTISAEHIGVEGLDFVRGTLAPSPGLFDYFSTANARGRLSFYYDGNDPSFKVDLTAKTSLDIKFLMFDFANEQVLPVTVTLSDGNNDASHTIELRANDPLMLSFMFADFDGLNALDMSEIRSIQVDFDPAIGADFRLNQMSFAVPAPGALALLAIGGLVGTPRRRRSAA